LREYYANSNSNKRDRTGLSRNYDYSKNIQKIPKGRRSLRTNVEATVSEFTRKMNNRKLKVRGYFKAAIFAFAVGISVNFGRIYRYLKAKGVEPVASTA